jgi:hypothetical protein
MQNDFQVMQNDANRRQLTPADDTQSQTAPKQHQTTLND